MRKFNPQFKKEFNVNKMEEFLFSEILVRHFWTLQVVILMVIVLALLYHFSTSQKSSFFKLKEHERWKTKEAEELLKKITSQEDELAKARMKKNKPLQLSGISLDGPAHKILDVPWNASPEEIEKAFKDKMKHYHPDKVAAPGSDQWNEAQKIAQTLLEARKKLLLKNKKES